MCPRMEIKYLKSYLNKLLNFLLVFKERFDIESDFENQNCELQKTRKVENFIRNDTQNSTEE